MTNHEPTEAVDANARYGMEPLETAPDIVPLTEAHRWLPMSRTAVYKAARSGQIDAFPLPCELHVRKTELMRIRGVSPVREQPEPIRLGYHRPRRRSAVR
jgi:hypothetical protein